MQFLYTMMELFVHNLHLISTIYLKVIALEQICFTPDKQYGEEHVMVNVVSKEE